MTKRHSSKCTKQLLTCVEGFPGLGKWQTDTVRRAPKDGDREKARDNRNATKTALQSAESRGYTGHPRILPRQHRAPKRRSKFQRVCCVGMKASTKKRTHTAKHINKVSYWMKAAPWKHLPTNGLVHFFLTPSERPWNFDLVLVPDVGPNNSANLLPES